MAESPLRTASRNVFWQRGNTQVHAFLSPRVLLPRWCLTQSDDTESASVDGEGDGAGVGDDVVAIAIVFVDDKIVSSIWNEFEIVDIGTGTITSSVDVIVPY